MSEDRRDAEKRAAALAAATLLEPGMRVGLGTGSTVAYLLPVIAARGLDGLTCVATSRATEEQAAALGIRLVDFSEMDRLDVAIDGTDQVTPDNWLIKGGGGAHTREKIVAAAAQRFVVIASSDKPVDRLHPPVPVELLPFGLTATLRTLGETGAVRVRSSAPPSPDGGVLADWHGDVDDPAAAMRYLESIPGLVGHGLFAPNLLTDVIIAHGDEIQHRN